ncbi:ATP-binding cassette domain-containing protein [candidate division TA06 bacterium]|uniref:ATP-binding cassette domain-containing protein n=1 Tax=candidate division TA06 bacterium TaxID=2250710 RepID=A0A523XRC7_UNCT6|nr:MAG: ATP-binding cassette domain-containing protein [candidate division TA06 bacterium]
MHKRAAPFSGGKNIEIYRLRGVQKSYQDEMVLDVESLSLESGLLHTVVGPNGSGKTTLMKLTSFLERPTKGTIEFKGGLFGPDTTVPQKVRRSVSMVIQDHYLFDGSVGMNVSYGLRARRHDPSFIKRSVSSALDEVGLGGFEHRRTDTLSGGESKRVAIARSVVLEPEVLLLDEPTANIDKISSEMIEQIALRLKSEGMTVIMSTHDFHQAYRLSDNMVSLVAGKMVDVSPENVFPCSILNNVATLKCGINISVATLKEGKGHIAIDPQDVLLSLEELESSARNCIPGTIKRISLEDSLVNVYLDIGTELVSSITRGSLEELRLSPGLKVYATFKATSVRVL